MKDKRIEKAYELGFSYEKQFKGCAQCTIAAIQDTLDIKNDEIFRAASSLAMGGGLTCAGACGGVSGGAMMISHLYGRRKEFFEGDDEMKITSHRLTRELHQRFIDTYGTVICGEIHQKIFGRNYDIRIPEEKLQFNEDGAHRDKCTSVVAKAAAWTVELILEEQQRRSVNT